MRFSQRLCLYVTLLASPCLLWAQDDPLLGPDHELVVELVEEHFDISLPPLSKLINRHIEALCPKFNSEVNELIEVLDQNDWFDTLVLDRIEGSVSKGEGLTVKDQTDSDRLLATQDTETWGISYKLPLSVFRQKYAADRHAERDLDVLKVKQESEVTEQTLAILGHYSDLSEAVLKYDACLDRGNKAACLTDKYKSFKALNTLLWLTSDLPVSIACKGRDSRHWSDHIYGICCEKKSFELLRVRALNAPTSAQ